jgi:phage-related protein
LYAYLIHKGSRFEIYALAKREDKIIYQTELYDELNDTLKEKIVARIVFLADQTPPILNDNVSKKVKNDLFELRIEVGNTRIRLFYFYFKKRIIITHGFIKKSRKTPRDEIKRAEKLMKLFINQ